MNCFLFKAYPFQISHTFIHNFFGNSTERQTDIQTELKTKPHWRK